VVASWPHPLVLLELFVKDSNNKFLEGRVLDGSFDPEFLVQVVGDSDVDIGHLSLPLRVFFEKVNDEFFLGEVGLRSGDSQFLVQVVRDLYVDVDHASLVVSSWWLVVDRKDLVMNRE
jgi:hypothetical protein